MSGARDGITEGAPTGVVWVTGYSASGKTSVGRKLKAKLQADGVPTVFLDGDDLRSILSNRWGYERADRIELARVYFRLCNHLASQGLTVVVAAVGLYDEVHEWLRENIPNTIVAYLDVPEQERRERDRRTKGLYESQNFKDVYDGPPADADLVIKNYGNVSPEQAADTIREFFHADGRTRLADRGRKQHWEDYYASGRAPVEPSPFARDVSGQLAENSLLLEVGCGNGRDASLFAALGHRVSAVDTAQAAIDLCLKRDRDSAIRYTCGPARALIGERERPFDVVYSRFCIHVMTRKEETEFLETASKVLSSSGRMFIECRSIGDPLALQGEVLSPTERLCGHYHRFIILDELEESLDLAGFEILEAIESKGLARRGDEDPVVIRIVARPK